LLAGFAPNFFVEGQAYPFEHTVVSELSEVPPDAFFGGQVAGNHTSLAAGLLDVEDSVEDFSERPGSWSAAFSGVVLGQQRLDLSPLRLGHVTGIAGTHAWVIAIKTRFLHRFLGAAMRKLLHIVFGVLKRGRPTTV
jgi:hypothetical protein